MNQADERLRFSGEKIIVPYAANFYNLNKCCVDANDHLIHNCSSDHKARHAYVVKGNHSSSIRNLYLGLTFIRTLWVSAYIHHRQLNNLSKNKFRLRDFTLIHLVKEYHIIFPTLTPQLINNTLMYDKITYDHNLSTTIDNDTPNESNNSSKNSDSNNNNLSISIDDDIPNETNNDSQRSNINNNNFNNSPLEFDKSDNKHNRENSIIIWCTLNTSNTKRKCNEINCTKRGLKKCKCQKAFCSELCCFKFHNTTCNIEINL